MAQIFEDSHPILGARCESLAALVFEPLPEQLGNNGHKAKRKSQAVPLPTYAGSIKAYADVDYDAAQANKWTRATALWLAVLEGASLNPGWESMFTITCAPVTETVRWRVFEMLVE